MAFTCGFYNGPNRMYNAEQLSSIFDGIISDGMYSNYRNSMIVIESENDSEVIVQPGRAWLMHTWSLVDANLPVVAPQSEVVLDRIDALVIDVNTNPEVKNNEITWVTGTPSSQDPQRPALLNEEFHKQYPLCYVYRAAGAEHIAQENITNAVGTSEFPFVTGIIDTINTDQLILQWEAQWETFMETYTSEAETWIDTQEGSFLTWSTAQRTAFETWFESIRGILDQDAAGHIMNIIDARIPAYDSENPAQQITAVRSRKGNYISELRVYANAKPRLFQSVDGGQTWEDSSVGGFEPVEISYEDYLELTDEEKDAGDWYVVGMPSMGLNAKTIPYNGNVSDAHNVEDAIDNVNQNLTQILNPEYVEVISDGVKKIHTILAELYTLVDLTKVSSNTYMFIDIPNIGKQHFTLEFATGSTLVFEMSYITKQNGQYVVHRNAFIVASDGSQKMYSADTSATSTTFGESSVTDVPPSGRVYRIYYK